MQSAKALASATKRVRGPLVRGKRSGYLPPPDAPPEPFVLAGAAGAGAGAGIVD
jgi:hypothetical protein